MDEISPELVARILSDVDQANETDPNTVLVDGVELPAELIYGQRMSETLSEFEGAASAHLQIAVRGQHIERWKRPRADYPEGRAGYLKWRRDAGAFHAQRLVEIMTACGCPPADCERVRSLARKVAIKEDPEAQVLEDVACLVFMRWYFLPFAAKHNDEDVLRIVTKTARKMSERGRAAALALPLPDMVVPVLSKSA